MWRILPFLLDSPLGFQTLCIMDRILMETGCLSTACRASQLKTAIAALCFPLLFPSCVCQLDSNLISVLSSNPIKTQFCLLPTAFFKWNYCPSKGYPRFTGKSICNYLTCRQPMPLGLVLPLHTESASSSLSPPWCFATCHRVVHLCLAWSKMTTLVNKCPQITSLWCNAIPEYSL